MTVYVVSEITGDSSYEVSAAFSEYEEAEKFLKSQPAPGNFRIDILDVNYEMESESE